MSLMGHHAECTYFRCVTHLNHKKISYNGRMNDLALVQNELLIETWFNFTVKTNFFPTL